MGDIERLEDKINLHIDLGFMRVIGLTSIICIIVNMSKSIQIFIGVCSLSLLIIFTIQYNKKYNSYIKKHSGGK